MFLLTTVFSAPQPLFSKIPQSYFGIPRPRPLADALGMRRAPPLTAVVRPRRPLSGGASPVIGTAQSVSPESRAPAPLSW